MKSCEMHTFLKDRGVRTYRKRDIVWVGGNMGINNSKGYRKKKVRVRYWLESSEDDWEEIKEWLLQ